MDGQFESHFSRQRKLNGSVDSWATEVEIHAASALYGVNVNIRIGNDQKFHIFSASCNKRTVLHIYLMLYYFLVFSTGTDLCSLTYFEG